MKAYTKIIGNHSGDADGLRLGVDSGSAKPAAGMSGDKAIYDDVHAMLRDREETLEQERLLMEVLERQSEGLRVRLGMRTQRHAGESRGGEG